MKFDLGELLAEGVAGFGKVTPDVHAGREEIGHHQHTPCPFGDAGRTAGNDVGLSQFEIRRLNDFVIKLGVQAMGQINQFLVGFLPAAAVGDQQNGFGFWVWVDF